MQIANIILLSIIAFLLSIIAFLLLVLVECKENAKDGFDGAFSDLIVIFYFLAVLAAVGFGIGYVFF